MHRSMHLIPQTTTWFPFKDPIPAISHFVRFDFSPKKIKKKVLNISTRLSMDCASLKKKCIIYICSIKEAVLKYLFYLNIPFISGCFLVRKKMFNTSMKSYAEIGSPWQVPLSELGSCFTIYHMIVDLLIRFLSRW